MKWKIIEKEENILLKEILIDHQKNEIISHVDYYTIMFVWRVKSFFWKKNKLDGMFLKKCGGGEKGKKKKYGDRGKRQ